MAERTSTSITLLGQVQNNEPGAWRTLVDLYTDYIRALLVCNQCRSEDLEDLTQDVLLTVFRKIPSFRPHDHPGAFRGWLKTIVRSKAIDGQRRNQGNLPAEGGTEARLRFQAIADSSSPISNRDTDTDPGETSALRSLYQRAMNLVQAECDPRTWQLFYRVAVQQESAAALARELGISAASIRMAKSRILRRLREVVGEPLRDDSAV